MRRFIPIFFVFAFVANGCVFLPNDDSDASESDSATDTSADGTDTAPDCALPEQACGASCVDTSTNADHCGGCFAPCQASDENWEIACVDSACEDVVGTCLEGYADKDGNDENGCECAITSDDDLPGNGDENCDGIDGNLAEAVFVKEGESGNGLTVNSPIESLQEGIQLAHDTDGKSQVLVASGSYAPITLASDIVIAGGYSDDFSTYDPANNRTFIQRTDTTGTELKTVDAPSVENTTLMSVHIIAADPGESSESSESGASTIGLHARNATSLTLRSMTIEGGKAANGADGETVSNPVNCDKPVGGPGGIPVGVSGCNLSDTMQTAPSGVAGEPASTLGGPGGRGGYQSCESQNNCTNVRMNGQPGQAGDPPANTVTHGMAPTNGAGTLDDGSWTPATGTAPTPGLAGGAGGGGGAGANCGTSGSSIDQGGAGGAGGDGGCGGKAGKNGESGGASFLILAVDSEIELDNVIGVPGRGGDGGTGSAGTAGGSGRNGQSGVDALGGDGGPGGTGAAGSAGGDGAGGCGGPAFGVAFNSASNINGDIDTSGETFVPGDAGDGFNNAPDGCEGVGTARQPL